MLKHKLTPEQVRAFQNEIEGAFRKSLEPQTIHARIEQMVKLFSNGNKSAFGRQADLQSGVLAGLIGGRLNKPSFEVIQRLTNAYPQVREEWLISGRGSMLKEACNPQGLKSYLELVRTDLSAPLPTSDFEKIEATIQQLESYVHALSYYEPAFKAIEQGIYSHINKAEVQDYPQLLEAAIKQKGAIEKIRETYLSKLATGVPSESSQIKGFIEVVETKGRSVLISLSSISHVYPNSHNATNAVIELTTSNSEGNIIIDTSTSFEDIKDLIQAAV
ncbi:hypothetical protein GCM10023185_24810 [Hymenobacter saemangeumensis]|uniref:Uncharacterized protein n=1 Tax=Hymenobacter saemangeumensis TaxID=1084522 RepID=A0ABP8IHH8_9BACT